MALDQLTGGKLAGVVSNAPRASILPLILYAVFYLPHVCQFTLTSGSMLRLFSVVCYADSFHVGTGTVSLDILHHLLPFYFRYVTNFQLHS